jgi:acetyl/propionyl-CoA carboxylase alpha subunit
VTYARNFARDGQCLRVQLKSKKGNHYQVQVGDRSYEVEAWALPDGRVRFRLDGRYHEACAARASTFRGTQVRVDGGTWALERYEAGHAAADTIANGVVEAPMTGTVLKLPVAAGADVEVGETVAVLTAMKMEHRLAAGITGQVAEVCVSEGDVVDQGTVLLRIEAGS